MPQDETSVSEAEVSAAAEAAISYMLANKADDRPAVVTAVHLARAALTAAAQVRAREAGAVYEECAKVADQVAINAERRAHGHVPQSAAQEAAFNKMEGAQAVRDLLIERVKKSSAALGIRKGE